MSDAMDHDAMHQSDEHVDAGEDFAELASRYLDDRLDPAGLAEFRRQLDEPGRAEMFVEICMQARLMNEVLTPELSDEAEAANTIHAGDVQPRRRWRWVGASLAGAAIAAALVIAATLALHRSGAGDAGANAAGRSVATLTNTIDARWGETASPTKLGSAMVRGPLTLDSGSAQLLMNSGAVVEMIGPCRFELVGDNHAILHSGRISAHVEGKAHGFTVEAPHLSVIDLGTDFGVAVDDADRTQVHVFKGHVRVDVHDKAGRITQAVNLTTDDAEAFDVAAGKVDRIEPQPWRFVTQWQPTKTATLEVPTLGRVTLVRANHTESMTPLADGSNTFAGLGHMTYLNPPGAAAFTSSPQWSFRPTFGSCPGLGAGSLHGWDETGRLMTLTTCRDVPAGRYEVYVIYIHRAWEKPQNIDDPGGVSAALHGQPLKPFDSRNGTKIDALGDGWGVYLGKLGVADGRQLVIDVGQSRSGKGYRTCYIGLAYRPVAQSSVTSDSHSPLNP